MGKLYLTKDEVPVNEHGTFFMPIHPKFLDETLKIDETLPLEVFPKAVNEWWNEIQPVRKKYFYIPEKKPTLGSFAGTYRFLGWESMPEFFDNGFVFYFSINREDGSMYYSRGDINCSTPLLFGKRISKEKEDQFINPKDGRIHVYSFLNLNTYPTGLLLRNWSLKYMNALFEKYL